MTGSATPSDQRDQRDQQQEQVPPDFASLHIRQLDRWQAHLHGNRFANLLAIKGRPGVAECEGRPPFFGEDGEALESALVALGWGSNSWCGVVSTLPEKGDVTADEMRELIEIIDPLAIISLDEEAMLLVQKAYGTVFLPRLPKPGTKLIVQGRAVVFVSGFESALTSTQKEEAKRRVWQELKAVRYETVRL